MNNTIRPDYYKNMSIDPHVIAEQESYNVGTAIVYLMRAGLKGSAIEDYRKAITHLEFEKELKGYLGLSYPYKDDKLEWFDLPAIFKTNIIIALITLVKSIGDQDKSKNEVIDKAIEHINLEIKRLEGA